MKPILFVELRNNSYKLQASDLQSGLKEALDVLVPLTESPETQKKVMSQLNSSPLTVENMKEIRRTLPGLRVTGHYLTLVDSSLLDRS